MRSRRRAVRSYRRRGPVREPYDLVLIACEGEKTEPNYIRALQVAYGLSSVNITILEPPRSDPLSIVEFMIHELRNDPEINRGYCIFDRHQHANFDNAIRRIRQSAVGRNGRLIAVPSVPCFEIWLLLHFRYSTGAYDAGGGESACQRVIRDLQRYLPGYAKGLSNVYEAISQKMPPRCFQWVS